MKPKYSFFKNSKYAIDGFVDILKYEKSFKIELVVFTFLWIGLVFAPILFTYKAILAISLFIPLIAESVNSAIERVVDLVTLDYHELAKRAKDVGSFVVFLSIVMTVAIWLVVGFVIFYG